MMNADDTDDRPEDNEKGSLLGCLFLRSVVGLSAAAGTAAGGVYVGRDGIT